MSSNTFLLRQYDPKKAVISGPLCATGHSRSRESSKTARELKPEENNYRWLLQKQKSDCIVVENNGCKEHKMCRPSSAPAQHYLEVAVAMEARFDA